MQKYLKHKARLGFLVPVIVVFSLLPPFFQEKTKNSAIVTIDKTIEIKAEVADSFTKRAKGLSGRDMLGENDGMLFVFPSYHFYSFWMKEMKFPIDMLWIRDNRIVDISKNVPSPANESDDLPHYSPREVVNYVLEVNAGFADVHGISVGSDIVIDFE